jgi:hypothetical protein
MLFLFLLIIVTLSIIWILKRKFTRERFAFFIVGQAVSVITLIVIRLFSSNLFLKIISWFIGKEGLSKLAEPTPFEFFAGLIIIGGFLYFEYKIYLNWKEPVSLRQHKQESLKEKITILHFVKDVKALAVRDKELVIYQPEKHDIYETFDFESEKKETSWHIHAAELLRLVSKQYNIDVDNDWYSEESCFISRYGKNNQLLGILCTHESPNDDVINRFVDVIKRHRKEGESIYKLVVAVKNGSFKKNSKTIQDVHVEFRYEAELLDKLVDFTDYKAFINKLYEEKEIQQGYGVTIKDVYTEPSCTLRRNDSENETVESEVKDIEKYIYKWLEDRKEKKQLALMGEYGQGKSVLALRLTYKLINSSKKGRIPILIELRGKFPKQSSQLSLLSDFAKDHHIEPNALLKLHYAGRLLLIFEGFDEMELIGDHNILYNHFKNLWAFSTAGSKIIITGRTNFFANQSEQQAFLRSKKQLTDTYYSEEIYLNKFDIAKINKALRHAPDDIRQDIMKILDSSDKNSSFYDLMSRPSLLFLASVVWEERNLSDYKENINSAFVINEFLTHSYSRQHEKEIDAPLTVNERAYFMLGIAVGMVELNGYTNQINQSSLEILIKKLYDNFPDEVSQLKTPGTNKILPLKERFDKKYTEETISLDVRSCGILVRDLSTSDSFKFAHKSFMELLVSDFYVKRLLKQKVDKISLIIVNAISRSLNASKNFVKTHEVVKFIAEILANNIRVDKLQSEKQKAEYVFKFLFPVKWLRIRAKFFNNLIFRLAGDQRKFNVSYFGTGVFLAIMSSCLLIWLREFSSLEGIGVRIVIVYLFIFVWTPVLFFILRCRRFFRRISDRKSSFFDLSNLRLWFLVCRELKIPEKVMKRLMPQEMYKLYNRDIFADGSEEDTCGGAKKT